MGVVSGGCKSGGGSLVRVVMWYSVVVLVSMY